MSGLSAHGTKFYWDDTPGPDGDAIGEVTNVTGPSTSVDTIDVTSHDSAGWREFVAGLGDFGELRFDINFHPAVAANNQIALFTDMIDHQERYITIEIPADPNWETPTDEYYFWAPGYIVGFEMAAPFDDKLSASVTVKLSGVPQHGSSVGS
jgi:predicted secreted protein